MLIVSKTGCEAASLAIKLVQDKSLWAECGHECPGTHQSSLKSRVHCFKGGVQGGQPRHQTSSKQVIMGGVRVSKVVFIISKAECEATSLAFKLVEDKSLWAECEATSLAVKPVQSESSRAECEAASLATRLMYATVKRPKVYGKGTA